MGSLNGRLEKLEGRIQPPEDERAAARRAIMGLILDELAQLRRSGESGEGLLEKACVAVAHDQYGDVQSPEMCDHIGRGWAERIRRWSRLDWRATTGGDGPG